MFRICLHSRSLSVLEGSGGLRVVDSVHFQYRVWDQGRFWAQNRLFVDFGGFEVILIQTLWSGGSKSQIWRFWEWSNLIDFEIFLKKIKIWPLLLEKIWSLARFFPDLGRLDLVRIGQSRPGPGIWVSRGNISRKGAWLTGRSLPFWSVLIKIDQNLVILTTRQSKPILVIPEITFVISGPSQKLHVVRPSAEVKTGLFFPSLYFYKKYRAGGKIRNFPDF